MTFYKGFAAITLFFVTIFAVLTFAAPQFLHAHAWFALIYCALITLLSHRILAKGVNKDDFYNYSMGASGLRLLGTAFGLIAYFYNFPDDNVLFALTFFAVYFTYQTFEIRLLLKKLGEKS